MLFVWTSGRKDVALSQTLTPKTDAPASLQNPVETITITASIIWEDVVPPSWKWPLPHFSYLQEGVVG